MIINELPIEFYNSSKTNLTKNFHLYEIRLINSDKKIPNTNQNGYFCFNDTVDLNFYFNSNTFIPFNIKRSSVSNGKNLTLTISDIQGYFLQLIKEMSFFGSTNNFYGYLNVYKCSLYDLNESDEDISNDRINLTSDKIFKIFNGIILNLSFDSNDFIINSEDLVSFKLKGRCPRNDYGMSCNHAFKDINCKYNNSIDKTNTTKTLSSQLPLDGTYKEFQIEYSSDSKESNKQLENKRRIYLKLTGADSTAWFDNTDASGNVNDFVGSIIEYVKNQGNNSEYLERRIIDNISINSTNRLYNYIEVNKQFSEDLTNSTYVRVYFGCNKTRDNCSRLYNNLSNFKGYTNNGDDFSS